MQTCIICGPDAKFNCKGHPAKRRREKIPVERRHVPKGECPACVCFGKGRHVDGKHFLQSPTHISDALKVGPVFCQMSQLNKRKLDWRLTFNVRNAARKEGVFCIELLEGWFDRVEVNEIWMNADTTIKVAA